MFTKNVPPFKYSLEIPGHLLLLEKEMAFYCENLMQLQDGLHVCPNYIKFHFPHDLKILHNELSFVHLWANLDQHLLQIE